ncbi:hypothetical protein COOONC_25577 [Cooperia oncophora]
MDSTIDGLTLFGKKNDFSNFICFFCSLSGVLIEDCKNSSSQLWTGDDSAGGSAGFFYFVNVAALVFVLMITFVYVVFWELYQSEKRIALGDLFLTALFFILFFFCSATWWAGSNTLGYATSEERISELMNSSDSFWKSNAVNNSLSLARDTSNGKLTISVVSSADIFNMERSNY